MPVFVRVKYPKCKGESDLHNEACLTCDDKEASKLMDGANHILSHYTSSKERQGTEREAKTTLKRRLNENIYQ